MTKRMGCMLSKRVSVLPDLNYDFFHVLIQCILRNAPSKTACKHQIFKTWLWSPFITQKHSCRELALPVLSQYGHQIVKHWNVPFACFRLWLINHIFYFSLRYVLQSPIHMYNFIIKIYVCPLQRTQFSVTHSCPQCQSKEII